MSIPLWQRTYQRARSGGQKVYQYRKSLLLGTVSTLLLSRYVLAKLHARKRDFVHPDTVLYWRIYDGSITEQRKSSSNLDLLLSERSLYADEPPRILTLFEVIRTLHWVAGDPRITGIVADFSSNGAPRVPSPYSLGLSQLEEIHDHMLQLKKDKEKELGEDKFTTIAFTDSFNSQSDYVFASAFDKVYCQPTGAVPLVGLQAAIPFFSKLLSWLGIKVLAEGRTKWKSMIAPYSLEELSEPQRENEEELLSDLNENMCRLIARNRFKNEDPATALQKVKEMCKFGPYDDAQEAIRNGLIDGVTYKRFVLEEALDSSKYIEEAKVVVDNSAPAAIKSIVSQVEQELAEKKNKQRLHGFYHYSQTMGEMMDKSDADVMEIGCVYLMGTIGEQGTEFGHESVIRGLREAANDKDIKAVVLRVDSGGGGVIASDSIWDAVRELKSKGKVVIGSFANAAASGGYLAACHVDAILAQPSTITGSIGVASLRPTVTQTFLDRFKINVQSFFTGSKANSLLHELEGEQLERHRHHIDLTYEDFKNRVIEGREIPSEKMEELAGGRVLTGSRAFKLTATPELLAIYNQQRSGQSIDQAMLDSAFKSLDKLENADTSAELAVDSTSELDAATVLVEAIQGDAIASTPTQEDSSAPSAFSRNLGHIGKGIIDGIGGIYDAAEFAAELSISKALQQAKLDNPDMPEDQLMSQAFPEYEPTKDDNGNAILSFDVRLKRFPAEKTVLQSLMAAARRGDSIDPATVQLLSVMRAALASFLLSTGSNLLRQQMREVGLDGAVDQMLSGRSTAKYAGSSNPLR